MKRFWLIPTLLFFVACGTSRIMSPANADVDRGKDNFPGLTHAQLLEGKKIYEMHCNTCHSYKKPRSRTAAEWKGIIPRMVDRANMKKSAGIDAGEQEALFRYVAVMSSAPK
jgi:cytochrome c5